MFTSWLSNLKKMFAMTKLYMIGFNFRSNFNVGLKRLYIMTRNIYENAKTRCLKCRLCQARSKSEHSRGYMCQAKGMSDQIIISIISTNLGHFGGNSGITVGQSSTIRWYPSIFQKPHRFP